MIVKELFTVAELGPQTTGLDQQPLIFFFLIAYSISKKFLSAPSNNNSLSYQLCMSVTKFKK